MYFIRWLVRFVDVYYLYFYGLACCKCDLTSIDLAIISYRECKYYCMRRFPVCATGAALDIAVSCIL
jgi:hypothetical protein